MANITWIEEEENNYDDGSTPAKDKRTRGEFLLNAEGDKLYIQADGPYGFFKVFTTRGPVPKELATQSWTDATMARAAVANYVERTVSSAKLKPKGEPAKIKTEAATKAKQTQVANKQQKEVDTNGEANADGPGITS